MRPSGRTFPPLSISPKGAGGAESAGAESRPGLPADLSRPGLGVGECPSLPWRPYSENPRPYFRFQLFSFCLSNFSVSAFCPMEEASGLWSVARQKKCCVKKGEKERKREKKGETHLTLRTKKGFLKGFSAERGSLTPRSQPVLRSRPDDTAGAGAATAEGGRKQSREF